MKKNTPQKLGSIIDSVLTKQGYYKKCQETSVITKWHIIVGDRISEVTRCTDVKDGIVYVSVANSSWRQEISYLKKEILSKIYKETKCTSIKDVVFY